MTGFMALDIRRVPEPLRFRIQACAGMGRFLRICTGNEHVFDSHASKKASFAGSSAVGFAALPCSSKTKTLSFDIEPVHTNDVTLSMTPCQQKNFCSRFISSFGIPSLSAGPVRSRA
jgi:hypothetical protein